MPDDRTYAQVMDQITQAFRLFKVAGPGILSEAEVAKAQRTIDMMDSAGAIFFPSEWMRANQGDGIDRQRRLVALYQHAARELDEIFPADRADGAEERREAGAA